MSSSAATDDQRRREYLLKTLLLGSLGLAVIAVGVNLTNMLLFRQPGLEGRLLTVLGVLGFFLLLLLLAGTRLAAVSAFAFTAGYLLIGLYLLISWGILLPQGILLCALAITISGIVLGSRATFLLTLVLAALVLGIAELQADHLLHPDLSWMRKAGRVSDALVFAVTFMVMAVVSWLANAESEKALQRARHSEQALKQERDLLEVRVEERTRELKQTQLERMAELYHFAEYGRLASGILHDLANPLTVVSLNLEELSGKEQSELIQQALEGAKRMAGFLETARLYVRSQGKKAEFSARQETSQALQLLSHKARSQRVQLRLEKGDDQILHGNSVAFFQLVANLLSNAIDSYDGLDRAGVVRVRLAYQADPPALLLEVADEGKGMAPKVAERIFEPFFTTKADSKGTGLGLAISRRIVEKEFGGRITVESQEGKGTVFRASLPLKPPKGGRS